MEGFGAYLKGFRESKGIRLEEIASITKIHLHNLELLEADRWEKLPPDPFLRGFIVAYGKYVGIETKELLSRYGDSFGPANGDITAVGETPATHPPRSTLPPGELIEQGPGFSTRRLAGGVGIMLIIGLLGGIVYLGKRSTDRSLNPEPPPMVRRNATETTPPVVELASAQPTQMEQAAALSAAPSPSTTALAPTAEVKTPPAAAASTAPANHQISIQGSERTWIKVVVDESAPIEYFLPQGDKVSYQAKEKIKIVLGNATGAKVFYNGKQTDGVNFLGTIRSYKFPTDAEFPQDTASKRMPTSAASETANPSAPNGRSN